jgi:hypothetical protein
MSDAEPVDPDDPDTATGERPRRGQPDHTEPDDGDICVPTGHRSPA